MIDRSSRRTFLQVTLALAGAGAGRSVLAQDDPQADIELEGRTSGWEGVAPDGIADETNPTLTLVDGEDYVLEWRNADGRPHNFNIEPEDGDNIVSTDIISSGSQTVEFTASQEMAEYYCEPHPSSMRGSVEIVDEPEAEGAIAPGDTGGADEGGDQQEDDARDVGQDDVEVTIEFALTEEGWVGQSPSQIEDEVNPTLPLEAGTVYEIAFTTEIGREDHQIGHNLLILNESGREVVHTDFLEEGQEGSVVFTAEGNLARYLDQTQLDVGGDIEVSGGDGGSSEGGGGGGSDGDDGSENGRIGVGIENVV